MTELSRTSTPDAESQPVNRRERLIWGTIFTVAVAWIAFRTATIGMGSAYVKVIGEQVTEAKANDFVAGVAEFSLSRTIGIWVAALLTLAVLSFLYRDNPLYKLAESIFIGVSAAYYMVISFWTVIVPNQLGNVIPETIQNWCMPGLSPVRKPDWYLYLVPLILGVMLLWRLAPFGAWVARWPLAFIIGTMAGLKLVSYLEADFLSQIHASLVPIIITTEPTIWENFWASVRSLLILLGMLATLVYFFFSIEHKGVVGGVSRVGIWVLMIAFGAMFGYTVMGRIALLVQRFQFLFDDWLWLVDPIGRRLGM